MSGTAYRPTIGENGRPVASDRLAAGDGGTRLRVDADDLYRLSEEVDGLEDLCRALVRRLEETTADLRRLAKGADADTRADVAALLATAAGVSGQLYFSANVLGAEQGAARRTWHEVRRVRDEGGSTKRPGATPRGGRSRRDERRVRARKEVARLARSQVGIREGAGNRTKYGRWYGLDGNAWCAMFVSWVYARSGHPLPNLQGPKGFAGVRAGAEALRRAGNLHRTPLTGDIYLHRGATWESDHTGIVVEVRDDGSFVTVEGNKGDAVRLVVHQKDEPSMFGFGRVI
ncbi:hypothetical protein GCM10028777_08760 [Angustibacter speluncae]